MRRHTNLHTYSKERSNIANVFEEMLLAEQKEAQEQAKLLEESKLNEGKSFSLTENSPGAQTIFNVLQTMVNERVDGGNGDVFVTGIDVSPGRDGLKFTVHTEDQETEEYLGMEFEFTKPKVKVVK